MSAFTGRETATTVSPSGVTYHQTEVVRYHGGDHFTLNTGGWRTATTKRRMNQAAKHWGRGWRVYQKAGRWFVCFYAADDGRTIPFDADTLDIHAPKVKWDADAGEWRSHEVS